VDGYDVLLPGRLPNAGPGAEGKRLKRKERANFGGRKAKEPVRPGGRDSIFAKASVLRREYLSKGKEEGNGDGTAGRVNIVKTLNRGMLNRGGTSRREEETTSQTRSGSGGSENFRPFIKSDRLHERG